MYSEEKDQVFLDYEEQEGGDVKSLPNFIPPEAQKGPSAPAASAEQVAVEPVEQEADTTQLPQTDGASAEVEIEHNPDHSSQDGSNLPPATQQAGPVVEPVVEPPSRHERIAGAGLEDMSPDAVPTDAEEQGTAGDKVLVDRALHDALMGVAQKVHAGAMMVDPEELQRMNAAVQQRGMIPGAVTAQGQQQVQTGMQALADGGMSLLGGAAALTGAAFHTGGKVASSLAGALGLRSNGAFSLPSAFSDQTDEVQAAPATGVAVLPRISEYRVEQAEKMANAYEVAVQQLWESGNLPNVRHEIEERARQTGLSVEDVMEKMKPNGEMADLREKFISAVAESSDAQNHKQAMDKALDGWVRQYGRGQEELLNPETDGNPHFESLRDRLGNSHGQMKKNTANAPLFEDDEKSHAEKLRETIERIMEKLKAIAMDFVNMVRGKKVADTEADNAPSPQG